MAKKQVKQQSLGEYLESSGVPSPGESNRRESLWKGPSSTDAQGGITFSLLSRFLVCRERFRLHVCEGLRTNEGWNHRLGYGEMWHVCEEALAEANDAGQSGKSYWQVKLEHYAREQCQEYPLDKEHIAKWYNVCKVQFPIYVKYWAQHPDVQNRTPLLSEQTFAVPYKLPSGRVVILRGKWDSVDLVIDGKHKAIWLQENKTKGDIKELVLQRQLKFDLQTMLYLVALQQYNWTGETKSTTVANKPFPVAGVRYNVVRRPLSGGKGTIVRHKATKNKPEETLTSYYGRLEEIIREDPGYFFMRWRVPVSSNDVDTFKVKCLNPVLEQLCDWWEWVAGDKFLQPQDPFDAKSSGGIHWLHPFGVYNVLDEGGSSDLDTFIETGNEVGLTRVDNLFPELQ